MAFSMPSVPPRPLAPRNVVAAFCERVREWSAAQITDLDQHSQTAGVLELDWSGPEPTSVTDLGPAAALRLTHHAYTREAPRGRLSHLYTHWLLPRGCKVIGTMPLLIERLPLTPSYGYGWDIGRQLAYQRRWDTGDHGPWSDRREVTCTGAELNQVLVSPAGPRPDVWYLQAGEVRSLDCALLAARYPGLTDLSLFAAPVGALGPQGNFGVLAHASALNLLTSLKRLIISGLFGMGREDCLQPDRVPALELLGLHDIPNDYAAAMQARWRPQIPGGTLAEITGARTPQWLEENMDNPLREWDGRRSISPARFAAATAQYKTTRRAFLAAVADGDGHLSRLTQIGREYAEAFNRLDGGAWFIETEEREELLAALDVIVSDAEARTRKNLQEARQSLIAGVEEVRQW